MEQEVLDQTYAGHSRGFSDDDLWICYLEPFFPFHIRSIDQSFLKILEHL